MHSTTTNFPCAATGADAPMPELGMSLLDDLMRARDAARRRSSDLAPVRIVDARDTTEVRWSEGEQVVVLASAPTPLQELTFLARGAGAVLDAEAPRAALVREIHRIQRQPRGATPRLGDLGTRAPAMGRLLRDARRIVDADVSVLLTGETGVGKEHLTRAIHASGPRAARPLIVVNCGALPENLLESQLFGHERGAFTGADRRHRGFFEAAEGGTLLLDEIGEMPHHLQVKLLTVLESREVVRIGSNRGVPVDVRVVAATNRDIESDVRSGTFRSDLMYRLNVVHLELPPLARRIEDLPALAGRFLHELVAAHGARFAGCDQSALDHMMGHDWPGNVRELRNVLERALLMAEGATIRREHLPTSLHAEGSGAGSPPGALGAVASAPRSAGPASRGRTLREVRDEAVAAVERSYLSELLEQTGGRIAETAELAGLRPRSLYDKMRQLDLRKEDFRRRS